MCKAFNIDVIVQENGTRKARYNNNFWWNLNQLPRVFLKKAILKNFGKFPKNSLWQRITMTNCNFNDKKAHIKGDSKNCYSVKYQRCIYLYQTSMTGIFARILNLS